MTTPYYPGITVTPNLGLSLIGMDEVVAEDFILIDAFAGGVSGSVEVNGVVVNDPNFVDSASAVFSVVGSNISITASGGGGFVNPMTTLGDMIYENATPAPARLVGNITATKMYLSQTGNGTISAVPVWAQIAYADISGKPQLPQTKAVVAHQFFASYDATTGLFTSAQPAASDISGYSDNLPIAGSTNVPSPLYTPDETPASINTDVYVQDVNGQWHAQAGIDVSTVMSTNGGTDSNPTNPKGILTWDRMMYFRDTQNAVQTGKNAFLSINHLAGTGTSYNNQDRAMWITIGNVHATDVFQFSIDASNNVTFHVSGLVTGFAAGGAIGFKVNQRIVVTGFSVGTYLNNIPLTINSATAISGDQQVLVCSDSGFTHAAVSPTSDTGVMDQVMWSMANLQMEQDVCGTPLFVSGVDTEASTLSVQMSDQHIGNVTAPNFGCNAIRAEYFREPGAGVWGSVHPAVIRSIMQDDNNGTFGFSTMYNIFVFGDTVAGNNDLYYSIFVAAPTTTRFGSGTYGVYIQNFGANAADYSLFVVGGQTAINGNVSLDNLTTVNAWPSEAANRVLAGPTSGAAAPATFRALVAADIPSLPYLMNPMTTLGDIIYENATPAPARLAGNTTITKMYLSQTGNGSISAIPAWAQINYADITGTVPTPPSGSVLWSALGNAGGNLTLSNAGFTTEFDQTSAVAWLWKNTTVATVSSTNASPLLELAANYWNGASAQDTWTLGTSLAAGVNKLSQLVISHSGTTGPAQIQVPATAGAANTPSLVFGSAVNTGGTYGPGLLSTGAGVLEIHPGDGSGNLGFDLRFIRLNTGTPTLSFDMTSASASVGGVIIAVQENTNNLQQIILASASGTAAGIGVAIGGNGGNNGRDFTATSGSQVGVSIGNTGAQGRLTFNPASGSASFAGLQVIPTINQTGTASGSYTGLLVNVTETAVLGTTNKLLDLQIGSVSKFAVDNTGKVTEYGGVATVKSGVASLVASVALVSQSAAISASTIYAVPAGKAGLYRISYSATITTAGTTSVLGGTNGFQSIYTSIADGQVKTSIPTTPVISAANTTGTEISGVVCAYAQASTNIQFNFGYTSTGTAMVYALEAYVEYLG